MVVTAAMKEDDEGLVFAPEQMKNTDNVLITAVKRNCHALEYASNGMYASDVMKKNE